MILFPAIDLRNGKCVRLTQGKKNRQTIYNSSPTLQAESFIKSGCAWLHVVDLDGAFEDSVSNSNQQAVRDMLSVAGNIPIQLGGGIRTLDAIESWLHAGIQRIILGTVAVQNPQLVIEAARQFPGQIVIGIDAHDGMVAINGWVNVTRIRVEELALQFIDYGVAAIIHTDITRDGMLDGPNAIATQALAQKVHSSGKFKTQVLASGGVSSIADLCNLAKLKPIDGVVLGKALYEKRFTLDEAIFALENRKDSLNNNKNLD